MFNLLHLLEYHTRTSAICAIYETLVYFLVVDEYD